MPCSHRPAQQPGLNWRYVPDPFRSNAQPQTLLILTGLPGSGKSTFAHALTSLPTGPHPHRKWTRASQDDSVSKRRQEVEATVLAALGRGENVVVDRVNFDAEYVDARTMLTAGNARTL